MPDFLVWNDAIAARFFTPQTAGRPVYLYVNSDLISAIGRSLGGTVDDFVAATKTGPEWATQDGLCQRAYQTYVGWRGRSLPYPPYIAYLALFVLAAGVEGDFAQHAYYPRLRLLIGLPEGSMLAGFERMFELWEDLEQWSVVDRRGELGIFRAKVVGGWIHVGYPIAQTILSESERRVLPRIFAAAAFDPTSPPPSDEIVRALRSHDTLLRARTRRLVDTRYDEEQFRLLIAEVEDELGEWNGEVEATGTETPDGALVSSQLRICTAVDLVARRATATLRFRLNRDFPEGAMVLEGPSLPSAVTCDEFAHGWSSVLQDDQGRPLNAAVFDWRNDLVLRENHLPWVFKLVGRSVRVFVEGTSEGLPGLVELFGIPGNRRFYLAFDGALWPRLESWAIRECVNFNDYGRLDGLPTGWHFASVERADGDTLIRQSVPILSFPTELRIRLVGGVRSEAGGSFFSFAPPAIVVDGGDGNEEVLCEGLRMSKSDSHYELPRSLPLETRISISVQRAGQLLARHSLYLTGQFRWQLRDPIVEFDRWGMPALSDSMEEPRFAGVTFSAQEPVYRQEQRGHPGPHTRYLRRERLRFSVAARVKDEVASADERSDGMFPLITNRKDLSLRRILEAYKFQPKLEKRHEQLKSVQDLAPMWLKNVARIEALVFLYFVALLVHALLEREVRRGMAREKLDRLPLYPEERECKAPSTERILDVFAPLQRHRLRKKGRLVQIFEPDLNELHRQILGLMRLPTALFRASR